MTFEPKSGGHAIVEAVFGLNFVRPFEPIEVDRIAAAHDEWREFLPRMSRGMGFHVAIGPNPIALPGASISFERMRPDGSLEWGLRLEGTSLFFNCLAYTRWAEVWPIASKLMSRIVELTGADNPIQSVLLQYIDVFEWQGPDDKYNVGDLLKAGAAVPQTVLSRGKLWHLHQGWYREEPRLPNGRLLERVHLDAVLDERGRPTVRMDSFLSFEHQTPTKAPAKWTKRKGDIGDWFNTLHDLDKDLLRSMLTEGVAERIKLDA